jgi:hypothetical protein
VGEIRGEAIDAAVLRTLVPAELCAGKTLIHRDGRWVQSELDLLHEHALEVGFSVLPVGVVKGASLIPRLYERRDATVEKCEAGTVFLVGEREAIVATNPARGRKLGTPMPLRVSVHPTVGVPKKDVDILSAVESVFWSSRVHFSSVFQQPRLPVTIKAVDEASWLLQSADITASFRTTGPLRGSQQFWL